MISAVLALPRLSEYEEKAMEPTLPQADQPAIQPVVPAARLASTDRKTEAEIDFYAQTELESRHERIERAIRKARHRLS